MRNIGRVWNSYFIRLVLSYSIMAIVLIAAVGGYLFSRANGLMVGEMTRESNSRLTTAEDYLEKSVLRKYVDGMTSHYFIGVEPDLKVTLYNLLDSGWDGHMSNIVTLNKHMNFIRSANDGIANFTVYFKQGNYVVDQNYFYPSPADTPDQSFIDGLGSVAKQRWMERTLPDGRNVLTYVLNLPYGFPDDKAKGFMFIDIERDYLSRALAQVMNAPYERLYVFGDNGRPLLQTGPDDSTETEHVMNALASATDGKVTIERAASGNKIIATLRTGSVQSASFQYAIVRPFDTFVLSSRQFQQQVIASCVLMLALGLLIAFVISNRFYVPLKALVSTIRGLYQPNAIPAKGINEYNLIDHTLHYLDDKIATLETRVKTNQLTNYLHGNVAELQSMSLLPHDCVYVAAEVLMEKGDGETFRRAYLDTGHAVSAEMAVTGADRAAVVYFFDPGEPDPHEQVRAELTKFRSVSQLAFAASIGSAATALEDIQASYRSANEGLRYTYLLGSGMIVSAADRQELSKDPYPFAYSQLKNAIRAGNAAEAQRFVADFAARSGSSVRLDVVELSVMQLLTALSETVIELNLNHIVSSSELFREKKPTFAETVDWIRTLATEMADYVQAGKTKGHHDMVHRLKTYIDEHLHEELSLDVLSEVANLSTSYISTLFADVLQVSFTEYVTKARLKMAAELLRSQPTMTVADIATRVGYRNSQYFCTKFKAKYAITPMQYRNSWAGAPAAELETE